MVEETTSIALARIQEIERRDDQQILAALGGELIEEYIYSFRDGRGHRQVGLSWAGVREMAQMRGNIGIDDNPDISEADDHFRVVVKATDYLRNVSVLAGCHQPKKMRVKVLDNQGKETGEYALVDDDFAFQKALSKAQRNAIKNLMPETVIKKLMDELLGKQRPKGKQTEGRKEEPEQTKSPVPPKAIGRDPQELTGVQELFYACWEDFGMQPSQVLKELGISDLKDIADFPDAYLQIMAVREPK